MLSGPRKDGDGSAWSVNEDWEASSGIVNDLFTVSVNPSIMDLRKRFTKEPLFSEVIEAIYDLDRERSDRERRRARHRAVGYQIDNGKLWRITNGRSIRARARVECISQTEAIELAKLEHGNNGHWGRDLVKLKMLDKIWSPRLDQSIVNAIL
ncbi:hypothetical protein PAXINDRAFT_90095, partial [Paxillus involutus ATCC 200175]